MDERIVSHHFYRRRARKAANKLDVSDPGPGHNYVVRKASRGPYRYYVVKVKQ